MMAESETVMFAILAFQRSLRHRGDIVEAEIHITAASATEDIPDFTQLIVAHGRTARCQGIHRHGIGKSRPRQEQQAGKSL